MTWQPNVKWVCGQARQSSFPDSRHVDAKGEGLGSQASGFTCPVSAFIRHLDCRSSCPQSMLSRCQARRSLPTSRLLVTYRDHDVAFVWTLEHLFKTNWQRSSSVQIKPPQPKVSCLSLGAD